MLFEPLPVQVGNVEPQDTAIRRPRLGPGWKETTVAYSRAGEVSWKSHNAAGVGSKGIRKTLRAHSPASRPNSTLPRLYKGPFHNHAISPPPHKPHLTFIDQTAALTSTSSVFPVGLLASLRLPRKSLRSPFLVVYCADLCDSETFLAD
jgi:hypothetical protein